MTSVVTFLLLNSSIIEHISNVVCCFLMPYANSAADQMS